MVCVFLKKCKIIESHIESNFTKSKHFQKLACKGKQSVGFLGSADFVHQDVSVLLSIRVCQAETSAADILAFSFSLQNRYIYNDE